MAVDELVNFGELLDARVRVRMHAGDELELRLAEIGGDVRVRQGSAERAGVRRCREAAVGRDAQAFLLDAAHKAAQRVRRQRCQAV